MILRYIKPQALAFGILSILLIAAIGLQLLHPLILGRFIDSAITGGDSRDQLWAALLFVLVALGSQVMHVSAIYFAERVSWKAMNALRADLLAHCLDLDMTFHHQHSPGELIERIDGDVGMLANFLSRFFILVVGNLLLLFGVLVLAFSKEWRGGLVLTGFSLASLAVLNRVRDIAVPYWKAERQANSDLWGFLEERLEGMEDIRSNGVGPYVLQGLYRLMQVIYHKSLRAYLMLIVFLSSTVGLVTLGSILTLMVGAYLLNEKLVTIGLVYILFYYMQMLAVPLGQLVEQAGDLQKATASLERVQELFLTPITIVDHPQEHLSAGPLSVEFKNVSFRYVYHDRESVLENISFRLQSGRSLGLIGRTGSGKTTLARLLFRLWEPESGGIYVDGRDIRQIGLAELRQRMGLVTQEVQLFQASVRDNLTLFNSSIPDQRVREVIEEVGLQRWYRTLSQGLDTVFGSGGWGLSAGEAQLLAFARVFLKTPGLVLLDEASSRLDPLTEELIGKAIDKLLVQCTAIIIAHRLATLQRVDDVMILRNGNVLEYGDRQQLLNTPQSWFQRLSQTELNEVLI